MSNSPIFIVMMVTAILILLAYFGFFIYCHHKDKKWYKPIIILGVIFSGFFAILPLYLIQGEDGLTSVILSIFATLKMFFFSVPYETFYDILQSQNDTILTNFYRILLTGIFLLAPLCTATVILSLVGNYITYAKIGIHRFKNRCVFSELNEKSFSLASSMKKDNLYKKGMYIFCGMNRDVRHTHPLYTKAQKEGFYVIDKDILQIKPAFYKKTHYYLFSANEDENIDTGLYLMEKYKERTNVMICVLSDEKESEYLLDKKTEELKTKNINLLQVNEQRGMTFDLLFNNPLYSVLDHGDNVSMLIIGGGELGLEVLKNSLWCSRSGGKYSFDVTIVDTDIKLSQGRFTRDCPGISLEDYHVSFYPEDINAETSSLLSLIEEQKGRFNYIVVVTDDDEINIKTALDLRALYLRNQWYADISIAIRNDQKYSLMLKAKEDSKDTSVKIFPFGSSLRMFTYEKLNGNIWGKYAKCINMIYENTYLENIGKSTDTSLKTCNSLWNKLPLQKKRSSRAHAIYLKYSLWLQGYSIEYHPSDDAVSDHQISDEEILEYAKIEHERWNTFTLIEGFLPWNYEAIKRLPENEKALAAGNFQSVKTQDKLLRLHGCITDWDTLVQMDTELKTSFVNYDIELVKHIPDIISGYDGTLGYHTIIK
ncbi:MAG: hypothetical protein PHX50_15435, partial [Massilibacteroides sp.]|nr:hypothetical protein [Massilibacteroides sp.]